MFSYIKSTVILFLLCSFLAACAVPEDGYDSFVILVSLDNQTAQDVVVAYRLVGSTEFSGSEIIKAETKEPFFLTWNSRCIGNSVAEANIYTADSERTLLRSVTDPEEFRKESPKICAWYINLN